MGEVYKMWFFKKMDISYMESFSIIALDRSLASLIILIGGVTALCYYKDSSILADNSFKILVLVSVFLIIILFCVIFRNKIKVRLEKVISMFKQIENRMFLFAFLLACFAYVLRLGKFYLLIISFGGDIGFLVLAIVLLVVQMSTLLPISFGSLGVMEGGIVAVLVYFGVNDAVALSTAIANRLLLLAYSSVGGFFFIQDMFEKRKQYGIKAI